PNSNIGELGEVCMRGHNVRMRHALNPVATAEAFSRGWFHSHDLGMAVEDADSRMRFFALTGRIKNLAKVRGESVSLDEMDRAILMLPQIRDAACVTVPHRLLGEQIIAVVVVRGDGEPVDGRSHLARMFA